MAQQTRKLSKQRSGSSADSSQEAVQEALRNLSKKISGSCQETLRRQSGAMVPKSDQEAI